MHKPFNLCGLLAAMLMNASVYAGDIQVEDVWIRATVPEQESASADMTITSKQNAMLIGMSTPACRTVEMHSMTIQNSMMKMREVKTIDLPAGKRVELGAIGYHLMLVGLKAPLKAGEVIPLALTIKLASERTVKVEAKAVVKPLTAANAAAQEDKHEHQH